MSAKQELKTLVPAALGQKIEVSSSNIHDKNRTPASSNENARTVPSPESGDVSPQDITERPDGDPPVETGDHPVNIDQEYRPSGDVEALQPVGSLAPPHSIFSQNKKRYIVFMVSYAGFFSPLSASIYFPALNAIAAEYKVSNTLINLTLTSYMIFQGLAPTFFGDMADMAGRRPAYFLAFVIYIAANIGLALQNTYAALFVLRCLQSSGSSATIALANGVIADVASSSERGMYMGFALSGPMFGPGLGAVLGGLLAQYLGWRAIFWFLTIMAVAFLVPFSITFPETGRNVVGNGSVPPQGWNMSLLNYLALRKVEKNETLNGTVSRQEARVAQADLANKRKLRWPNPLKTIHIILEKDVGMLLFYNAIVYTAFYDVISSLPSVAAQIYDLNDLQIGLIFLPFGVGCGIAAIASGKLMDFNYRRVAKEAGITIDKSRGEDMKTFPIEKARLQVVFPLLYCGAVTILCYGWVLQKQAHLAAPLVLQFLMGFFLTGAFNVMSVMLVDFYPLSPATASAANNLVRCWMGAGGIALIVPMIEGMGLGWCFTFVGLVVLCTSPLLWVLLKWGPKWREERRARIEQRRLEKEARRTTKVREKGWGLRI